MTTAEATFIFLWLVQVDFGKQPATRREGGGEEKRQKYKTLLLISKWKPEKDVELIDLTGYSFV